MLYFFEVALSWAYLPDDNPLPKEDIEQVLVNHKTLDMESFLGNFYLWQYVCEKLPLPIPQLEWVIPFTLSQWNAIKSGSDIITKLLLLNMYDPPCNATQSHAIAQMILLGCVVVHHLNHFFTAKDNLEEYPSLKHFHKAVSERNTFHNTLLQIVDSVKNKESFALAPLPASSSSSIITRAHTRKQDTRAVEVAWGSVSTGATPQRGVKKWYDESNPNTVA
jgi:hypothetical protein